MALKVSGGSSSSSSSSKCNKQRSYPEFDTISEGVPYDPYNVQTGSPSSTPAWDITRATDHRPFSRFSTSSSRFGDVMLEEEDEPKEWIAHVEPGVQITFLSLRRGGNDLKRIRFSRDMFDKFQAQRWWGENFDRIRELYNVQKFNQQALNTPGRSEDGRDSVYSRLGSAFESPRMTPSLNKESTPRHNKPTYYGGKDYFHSEVSSNHHYYNGVGSSGYPRGDMASVEASRTTTSSRDEASVSVSNASDMESEWIQEDEPGVYITIRQLMDGTRELRRVRFSGRSNGSTKNCTESLLNLKIRDSTLGEGIKNWDYALIVTRSAKLPGTAVNRKAVKNLEKCMRGTGGRLTEIGYELNISASNLMVQIIQQTESDSSF
ncbi:hypothetical protein OROGR_014703 [Orobanche gracilis]